MNATVQATGGSATISLEMSRPIPPKKIMHQMARNKIVCFSIFGISYPIYASATLPVNPLLDSNLRFFGGVWFGLGLADPRFRPSLRSLSIRLQIMRRMSEAA